MFKTKNILISVCVCTIFNGGQCLGGSKRRNLWENSYYLNRWKGGGKKEGVEFSYIKDSGLERWKLRDERAVRRSIQYRFGSN